jgi:hypothetical protein
VSIGTVTEAKKVWLVFQALGDVAFAYAFSMILIEIQVKPTKGIWEFFYNLRVEDCFLLCFYLFMTRSLGFSDSQGLRF